MKIGDRVKSTKIGPLAEGIVKGCIDPKFYSTFWEGSVLQPDLSKCDRWHAEYPDFMDKPLVYVEYNQKHFVVNDEDLKFYQDKKLELHNGWLTSQMLYPIDALEVVDQ